MKDKDKPLSLFGDAVTSVIERFQEAEKQVTAFPEISPSLLSGDWGWAGTSGAEVSSEPVSQCPPGVPSEESPRAISSLTVR